MRFLQRGVAKNKNQLISVCVTDKFGTDFTVAHTAQADANGEICLDSATVGDLISNCTPPKKSSFLIPEYDSYTVKFTMGTVQQTYSIDSGIESTIEKEEWRGGIIGNVFYPKKSGKFKTIVHLNGSVQLLQDARSVMLAREGYLVLELAYNLPQYGQVDMYERSHFPLEYIEQAIDKILKHPRAYGDEVCIMGHSKGGNLALASSAQFRSKVGLTISSCCQINAPVFTDLTYGSLRQYNTGFYILHLVVHHKRYNFRLQSPFDEIIKYCRFRWTISIKMGHGRSSPSEWRLCFFY